MKKLLVILLLLFSVHGAWAEEPINKLFGIKLGEECNSISNSISSEREPNAMYKIPKRIWNDENEIGVFPRIRNNLFINYSVHCTKNSNVIYQISAASIIYTEAIAFINCKEKLKTLKKHYITKKKYKFRDYTDGEISPQISGSESIDTNSSRNTINILCNVLPTGDWLDIKVVLYLWVRDNELHRQAKSEEDFVDTKGLD